MKLFSRRRTPWFRRLYQRFVREQLANDLQLELQLAARRESAEYVRMHMRQALICAERIDLHRLAFDHVTLDGLVLELGVKSGATLRPIAGMAHGPVHGFDSFEGLPEDWGGTSLRRGRFSTGGRLPEVPANVTLHAGWFDQTLPAFAATHEGAVAFMHVDCDLYSSTRTAFEVLGARIVAGTVMVFDEYFNYPNWQDHEYRAFQEFAAANAVRYTYLGFTARGGSVAVRIDARG